MVSAKTFMRIGIAIVLFAVVLAFLFIVSPSSSITSGITGVLCIALILIAGIVMIEYGLRIECREKISSHQS